MIIAPLKRRGTQFPDRIKRAAAMFAGRGLAIALLACAVPATAKPALAPEPETSRADFRGEAASENARAVADWVVASGNSNGLPFVIVDKTGAKVFVFSPDGAIRGAAAALLGLGPGDDSVPGIGQRKLATITPAERTTPAGRFEASLGNDFEQDILWVDYETSLSLHRVIVGRPADHRKNRLATPTPLDNRISYGCINVPVDFYDTVVMPIFTGTVGIVYILPETKPIEAVFPIHEPASISLAQDNR